MAVAYTYTMLQCPGHREKQSTYNPRRVYCTLCGASKNSLGTIWTPHSRERGGTLPPVSSVTKTDIWGNTSTRIRRPTVFGMEYDSDQTPKWNTHDFRSNDQMSVYKCNDCGEVVTYLDLSLSEPSDIERKLTTCESRQFRNLGDRVQNDPMNGKEVYSILGGEVTLSDYCIQNAARYVEGLLLGKMDVALNVGVYRGCETCEKLADQINDPKAHVVNDGKSAITIKYNATEQRDRHVYTMNHLSVVLMVPRQLVTRVMDRAVEMLQSNEESEWEKELAKSGPVKSGSPLWVGAQTQGYQNGWRGFFFHQDLGNMGALPQTLTMRGANRVEWAVSEMEATCHGDRGRCIEHLRVGGDLRYLNANTDKFQSKIRYGGWDKRKDAINLYAQTPQAPKTSGGSCMCGIYGYFKLDYAKTATMGDNFPIMAYVGAWGVVSEASDGFKASDVGIQCLFLLKDRIAPLLGVREYRNPWASVSINYDAVATALFNQYQRPIQLVDDWNEMAEMVKLGGAE